MKKKILSVISLVLALIMVLPVSVFAADPVITADKNHDGGSAIVVYDGGTAKNTVKLSVAGYTVKGWEPSSDLISIAADGTVTVAKKLDGNTSQDVTVSAWLGGSKTVTATVTVKKYKVDSIEFGTTKTDYISGNTISKTDINVIATYSDGTKGAVSDFDYSPKTALTTNDKRITVTYTGVSAITKDITVADVGLSDIVSGISVVSPKTTSEYGVGDILKPSDIQIKISYIGTTSTTSAFASENSDVKVSLKVGGEAKVWSTTSGYTFSSGDSGKVCEVKVEYAGKSKTVSFTVKSTTTSTGYTATLTNPTKKTYEVGEKFDLTGATITVKYNGSTINVTSKSIDYTFKTEDIGTGKTYKLVLSFYYNSAYRTCEVDVSGLTVKAAAEKIDAYPTSIISVELKNAKYPVGYTFSIDDIEYIYAKFASGSKLLTAELLKNYTAYSNGKMDIEVLDKTGEEKSASKAHTIYEDDVVDGAVQVLFYFSDKVTDRVEYVIEVDVGNPDISFIYEGSLIAEYDDIEDALEYTNTQDENVTDFKLSELKSYEYITLKLGKDFEFYSRYEFNPTHNVVIDLNGKTLTIDSDQIEVLLANKAVTVTVKNSSSTEGKLIYDDLDTEIVLNKTKSVVFRYGEDVPGLYTITINKINNGKLTADREIDDNEIIAGYGSDIEFTITPNSGYVIDSLKVGTTVIDDDDYTEASNGVVTYILEDIDEDATVYVTFKKGTAGDDWTNPFNSGKTNPFTDVYKTSTYYSAIRFVYTNGLFQGTESNKFEPNTTMTRAMFVTVIGRLAEQSGVTIPQYKDSSYTDVVVNKDTIWYTPYVEWATQNGVIQGHGDGTFGPDDEITHEQMYAIMYRYAMFVAKKNDVNVNSVSIESISDKTSISDWAVDAVKYAKKNEFIVYPSGTRIAPAGDAKRYELAQLLEGFCDNVLGWED